MAMVVSGIALATTLPSSAQSTALPSGAIASSSEQDILFNRILKTPNDLDASFRHAEVATANGDLEAAIGSLERLLFYNPKLQRVMLELGALYFRLGSYEISREYFRKATAAPDTPVEVRARVEAYLVEIEKRLNPNQTNVFVQTGLRYQTNANAGPDGTLMRVFGFDAVLDKQFAKAKDSNWFGQGVVRHVLDLGNQRGDAFETTLSTYNTEHRNFQRLNTNLLDIQTGPRLAILPEIGPGASFRPYIGAARVLLGGDSFLSAQTIGGALAYAPTPGWSHEVGLERVRRRFFNSDDYASVEAQSGFMNAAYASLTAPLIGGWSLYLRGTTSKYDALAEWQSFRQTGVELSLSYTLSVPIMGEHRRLSISPFAGLLETRYGVPDAFVDPNVKRLDREKRAGLTFDLQITDFFGIGVRAQVSKTMSSLPNYENENISIFGGPTFRY